MRESSGILPEMSVPIKGTAGTEIDFDEKDSIQANTDDVLSFSYNWIHKAEKLLETLA